MEDRAEATMASRVAQLRVEAQSVLLRSNSELEEALMLRFKVEELSFQSKHSSSTAGFSAGASRSGTARTR